jgi:glucuronosyltransferase
MTTYFEENIASDPFRAIDILWFLGLETSKHAMNSRRVQELIHDKDLKFDLVIAEQFYQESFLMFAHKYQTPLITLGTLSYSDFMDRSFGLLTPWSYVPHFILEFSDNMDLSERLYNVALSLYDSAMRRFKYLPAQNEVAQLAFAGLTNTKPLPTVQELEQSIDLMLVNHHHVFSRPRPKLPGLVDIAGVHIREPKPLPPNIQAFIDKHAEQGVIFFSLGSYLRASAMPAAKLKIFLETFAKLPYGIIWKWETDSIPDLPANVLIQKWLPQNDILANPRVKLFMTHGGLFGTQEAVYRGQPMVFFPCYGDQYRNSYKLMRAGLGRVLNLVNFTATDLEKTVLEVATNPKYKRNVVQMSTMFRNNLNDPLAETMYWIEYVIRHDGTKHLWSAARNLSWYQYLLLDVVAIVLGVVVLLTLMIRKLLKACKHTGNKRDLKRD